MDNYNPSFQSIIEDVLIYENIMVSVRNEVAITEVRLDRNTPVKFKHPWVTIGNEQGPWHIHVNSELLYEARFIVETKESDKKGYSLRFFDFNGNVIFRINFIKIYDQNGKVNKTNLDNFERLFSKYGNNETLNFKEERNPTA